MLSKNPPRLAHKHIHTSLEAGPKSAYIVFEFISITAGTNHPNHVTKNCGKTHRTNSDFSCSILCFATAPSRLQVLLLTKTALESFLSSILLLPVQSTTTTTLAAAAVRERLHPLLPLDSLLLFCSCVFLLLPQETAAATTATASTASLDRFLSTPSSSPTESTTPTISARNTTTRTQNGDPGLLCIFTIRFPLVTHPCCSIVSCFIAVGFENPGFHWSHLLLDSASALSMPVLFLFNGCHRFTNSSPLDCWFIPHSRELPCPCHCCCSIVLPLDFMHESVSPPALTLVSSLDRITATLSLGLF